MATVNNKYNIGYVIIYYTWVQQQDIACVLCTTISAWVQLTIPTGHGIWVQSTIEQHGMH